MTQIPLGIQHWPAWLGLGLLRLLLLLPYPVLVGLGRLTGRLVYPLAWRWRLYTHLNLKRCFPEMSVQERHRLARKHFEAVGVGLFEIGLGWWASERRLRKWVQIEGLEFLQQARAEGGGVILMSAHFTSLEIGGRLLGLHTPFDLMYKENRSPVLEWVMRRNRCRHFDGVIRSDQVREMLRSLRRGRVVWYAPDLGYVRANSAMVRFFGTPAPTNTATPRVARAGNARVLPFYPERLPGARGYRLRILPPLEDFPGKDPVADTERTNRILEEQILRIPEQYFWSHDRFKTKLHKRWPSLRRWLRG